MLGQIQRSSSGAGCYRRKAGKIAPIEPGVPFDPDTPDVCNEETTENWMVQGTLKDHQATGSVGCVVAWVLLCFCVAQFRRRSTDHLKKESIRRRQAPLHIVAQGSHMPILSKCEIGWDRQRCLSRRKYNYAKDVCQELCDRMSSGRLAALREGVIVHMNVCMI